MVDRCAGVNCEREGIQTDGPTKLKDEDPYCSVRIGGTTRSRRDSFLRRERALARTTVWTATNMRKLIPQGSGRQRVPL